MKDKIKNLKKRIEKNHEKLYKEYGENCQLIIPTLEIINLFLSIDAPNDMIEKYLKNVERSIQIIEEKMDYVEKNTF